MSVRRTGLLALIAVTTLALVDASAQARSRCPVPANSSVLAKSSRLLVVKTASPPGRPPGAEVTACWRATGRRTHLGYIGWNPDVIVNYENLDYVTIAGRFVAFSDRTTNPRDGAYYGSVRVIDVSTGRPVSSDPGGNGGLSIDVNPSVTVVRLNQAGQIVFQVDEAPPRDVPPGVSVRPLVSRIQARDSGGLRTLAEGPAGSLSFLKLRGGRVSFLRDSVPQYATLR